MSATGTLKAIAIAALAFVAISFAWSAGTGMVAGGLDVVGIHVPGKPLIAASPLAGAFGAGYMIWGRS